MKLLGQDEIEKKGLYESSYWGSGFEPDGDISEQWANDKEVWGSGFAGISANGYVVFLTEAYYSLHRKNLDEVCLENRKEKRERISVIQRWMRALT